MTMAQTENHISRHKLWVFSVDQWSRSRWFCHDLVKNLDWPLNENKEFSFFSHFMRDFQFLRHLC